MPTLTHHCSAALYIVTTARIQNGSADLFCGTGHCISSQNPKWQSYTDDHLQLLQLGNMTMK